MANSKFIYATAAVGPSIKIALPGYIDQDYIRQQLLNAGVPMEDLNQVSYSTQKPSPLYQLRSSFPSRAEVFAQSSEPYPPFPRPANANAFPAIWSDIKAMKYTPLADLQKNGRQFCMLRNGGAKENLFDFYEKDKFVNAGDWNKLEDKKIGLLFGIAWRQVDSQKVIEGMNYQQTLTLYQGMEKQTEYSLSTTLGVNYGAVSAELTATFGQTFTISESSTYEESFALTGIKDKAIVLGVWQLTDLFFLVEKKGEGDYDFLDSYDVTVYGSKDEEVPLSADPLFFGNTQKTDGGDPIRTSIYNKTSDVRQDTNIFSV